MKVLIACEFSGTVRDAFLALGHNAWSCDLISGEHGENHYIGDVRGLFRWQWDLMIAHPPCTHLCASGARWWPEKKTEQKDAIQFVKDLLAAPIPKIALENPIGILSSAIRKPEQIIHPWQFGHPEKKATCLWLKNLPPLAPTEILTLRMNSIHTMPGNANQARNRSRTFKGIAKAMAQQWGTAA